MPKEKPQPKQSEEEQPSSNKLVVALISVLATALVVGGGVYFWQSITASSAEDGLLQQITNLQKEVNALEEENEGMKDRLAAAPTEEECECDCTEECEEMMEDAEADEEEVDEGDAADDDSTDDGAAPVAAAQDCDVDLPVVVFERPGLLNNTAQGQAEKQVLRQKLIDPYVDYQADRGLTLVSLDIIVPENIGEEYEVLAIFEGGGTEGFLFGEREGIYDYWEPECMDECEFSDEYKAKYPHVAD